MKSPKMSRKDLDCWFKYSLSVRLLWRRKRVNNVEFDVETSKDFCGLAFRVIEVSRADSVNREHHSTRYAAEHLLRCPPLLPDQRLSNATRSALTVSKQLLEGLFKVYLTIPHYCNTSTDESWVWVSRTKQPHKPFGFSLITA